MMRSCHVKVTMRADMAKVIVERPRRGSRSGALKKGYLKSLQRASIDELPTREPMLGHWRGRGRWLNEHLGPLRKFLRSCVGRPWNKVHKELCEHVKLDNAVQNHVLTHIFQYVELHVEIRDGRPCYAPGHGWRQRWRQPLSAGQMYVCPQTGLLRAARPNRSRRPPTRIMGEGHMQFHQRDGQWWELQLRPLPEAPVNQRDVWLERPLSSIPVSDSTRIYGGKLFAISKRLLTRHQERELYRRLRIAERKGRRPRDMTRCP